MKGYILSNENKYYERGAVIPSHSWNAFKQRNHATKAMMVNIKAFYGKKEYTPFSTDHSRILYNTTFFLTLHTIAWFRSAQNYVCPMYDP